MTTNLPAAMPKYHANLPAFLQSPDLFAATDAAVAGIGGGQPPYISIRGSRFHLVDAAGEEAMVNSLSLDVIVLAGNQYISKMYYEKGYDPAASAGLPPDCWSDNGTGPSSQAMHPQFATCANCPKNAWGSKINPTTGSEIKACSDSKKLAVLLAADTPVIVNGAAGVFKAMEQVYLLRVPAASMKNWASYAKDIRGRGVPIIGVVSQLQFDSTAGYPALLFKASSFVTEPMFRASEKMLHTREVGVAIGNDDVPRQDGAAALPKDVPAHLQPVPPSPTPSRTERDVLPPPPAPAAAAPASAPKRPRGRPAAAVAAQAPTAVAASPFAPSPIGGLGSTGNGAPPASVIQTPLATDAGLDALLAKAGFTAQ